MKSGTWLALNNELQSVKTRDEKHIEWEDESSGGGGVGESEMERWLQMRIDWIPVR